MLGPETDASDTWEECGTEFQMFFQQVAALVPLLPLITVPVQVAGWHEISTQTTQSLTLSFITRITCTPVVLSRKGRIVSASLSV